MEQFLKAIIISKRCGENSLRKKNFRSTSREKKISEKHVSEKNELLRSGKDEGKKYQTKNTSLSGLLRPVTRH